MVIGPIVQDAHQATLCQWSLDGNVDDLHQPKSLKGSPSHAAIVVDGQASGYRLGEVASVLAGFGEVPVMQCTTTREPIVDAAW